MKIWLSLFPINKDLIFSNKDFFEEFMKMLHNAYVTCFNSKEYVKAECIQEIISTFEQERENYFEVRREEELSIEKSLDNKA